VLIPRTYRLRLVFYTIALLVFLVAMLGFSYQTSRSLILEEAEINIGRVSQQIEGQLRRDARDAAARVKMIRDNVPLTEYMFISVSVNSDVAALRELYQRQFGWLPAGRVVLLARNGKAMIGPEHADLIQALRAQPAPKRPLDKQFYFYGKNGLELVSVAAVNYRQEYLGVVAITETLGTDWMAAARQISNGHLIMAIDGKIILTTLDGDMVGKEFNPESNVVHVVDGDYLVRRIPLAAADARLPTIWFALSEAGLTQRLTYQRNLMVLLAVFGCLGILLAGFLILRNFSTPLGRLLNIIHEVGAGRLPEFRETRAQDEIGYLWNQFASMVQRLRENQEEITKVHSQLAHQAITDALTGLYNRRYLYEIFPKLYPETRRQQKSLTVILADLDKFKEVNDRFGHPAGDQALIHFSRILQECSRVSDFVFRVGGEEFLMLVTGDLEGGRVVAEKVRLTIEHTPFIHDERLITLTASFGVAQTTDGSGKNALQTVLAQVDKALYAAKHEGRNRVVAWNEALARSLNRASV
jgi:diguanylate cyclase (GGDEF)-like protein